MHIYRLSISEQYHFDEMGAPPEENKQDENFEAIKIPIQAQTPLATKDEGGEDSQEDEEGDDGDDEEFLLFYDRDEIESTKEQQLYDAFEDIREVKNDSLLNGLAGN